MSKPIEDVSLGGMGEDSFNSAIEEVRRSLSQSGQTSNDGNSPPNTFRKVGLLVKLGSKVKNWLERGFVLLAEAKLLLYFRSAREFALYYADCVKHSDAIAGAIPLDGATMFSAFYAERDNCLEISTQGRHYYVAASTRHDIHQWIRELAQLGVIYKGPLSNALEIGMLQELENSRVQYGMQGFLEKRGAFINHSFQRRFFRIEVLPNAVNMNDDDLKEDVCYFGLGYYVRFDDQTRKGFIPFHDSKLLPSLIEATNPAESPECQFGIETPNRKYVLRSRVFREKQVWLDILERFMDCKGTRAFPPIVASIPDGDKEEECNDDNDVRPKNSKSISISVSNNKNDEGVNKEADGNGANETLGADVFRQIRSESMAVYVELADPDHDSDDDGVVPGACDENDSNDVTSRNHERYLESAAYLAEGGIMVKHGHSGKPKVRLVFLNGKKMMYVDPIDGRTKAVKFFQLHLDTQIVRGKHTATFQRAGKQYEADRCFSLINEEGQALNLTANSAAERSKWIEAIQRVVAHLREKNDNDEDDESVAVSTSANSD